MAKSKTPAVLTGRIEKPKTDAAKARKSRRRRYQIEKAQAAKLSSPQAPWVLDTHRIKSKAALRWLYRQYGKEGRHGISEESHHRLKRFWNRPHPEELVTISTQAGAEKVPDMDEETLAHWRRFEEAWRADRGEEMRGIGTEAASEAEGDEGANDEDEDEEDGGVEVEVGEVAVAEREVEMEILADMAPEPVSASEAGSDEDE